MNNLLTSTGNLLEDTAARLLNKRKDLEKMLIRFFIANQSYTTSENRKHKIEKLKQTHVQKLTNQSTTYTAALSSAAKGKWINKARQAVKETSELFSQLP